MKQNQLVVKGINILCKKLQEVKIEHVVPLLTKSSNFSAILDICLLKIDQLSQEIAEAKDFGSENLDSHSRSLMSYK